MKKSEVIIDAVKVLGGKMPVSVLALDLLRSNLLALADDLRAKGE